MGGSRPGPDHFFPNFRKNRYGLQCDFTWSCMEGAVIQEPPGHPGIHTTEKIDEESIRQ